MWTKPKAGYLVGFRHTELVAQNIERVANEIMDAVDGLPYQARSVHTTLFTCDTVDAFPQTRFSPETGRLRALADALERIVAA